MQMTFFELVSSPNINDYCRAVVLYGLFEINRLEYTVCVSMTGKVRR